MQWVGMENAFAEFALAFMERLVHLLSRAFSPPFVPGAKFPLHVSANFWTEAERIADEIKNISDDGKFDWNIQSMQPVSNNKQKCSAFAMT